MSKCDLQISFVLLERHILQGKDVYCSMLKVAKYILYLFMQLMSKFTA